MGKKIFLLFLTIIIRHQALKTMYEILTESKLVFKLRLRIGDEIDIVFVVEDQQVLQRGWRRAEQLQFLKE